jgi:molybdate transport system substrate-binding protein
MQVGCAGTPSTLPPTQPVARPTGVALTVFAAASLGPVLEALLPAWTASHGGEITLATDSSAALATQIEEGARADVFLSADVANAERLVDGGLAAVGAHVFAGNELTIIVPHDDPAGIASPLDLARPGVRIVAAGGEVPITRYATELVDALAELDGYPTDFAEAYAANVVTREDNVRAVVAKVALGEGDAAIVYRTDAASADGVRSVMVPDEANVTASYAGVVVATSDRAAGGQAFLDWLTGDEAQAILERFGFLPPPS